MLSARHMFLHEFQSTLPTRGATRLEVQDMERTEISIHAPHTGSDLNRFLLILCKPNFNPRSPHGERPNCRRSSIWMSAFQSTLPTRGATPATYIHAD